MCDNEWVVGYWYVYVRSRNDYILQRRDIMIIANFDNVTYAYVSESDDAMVVIHFVDGTDMPLFGEDAVKLKSGLGSFVRTTQNWNVICDEGGE
jgi:hypothetical protein